jgi:opacity protein-like surface antigen
LKYVLGMAAALLLSAVAAPAAQAEPDFATVEVKPTTGWAPIGDPVDHWYGKSMPARFEVKVTNRLHDEDSVNVRITFPADLIEVTGYDGGDEQYGWKCDDVDEGLDCTNDKFYAVADEAWPTLTIRTVSYRHHQGSFDVYASADEHPEVHGGFRYVLDTST